MEGTEERGLEVTPRPAARAAAWKCRVMRCGALEKNWQVQVWDMLDLWCPGDSECGSPGQMDECS